MKAEDLVAVIVRGVLQGLVPEPVVTPTTKVPAKVRRPRRSAVKTVADAPKGATVTSSDLPTPSFDNADQPLPGFEGIPRATLREMEVAMEKITRGRGPAPGMYDKDDPNNEVTGVPLS